MMVCKSCYAGNNDPDKPNTNMQNSFIFADISRDESSAQPCGSIYVGKTGEPVENIKVQRMLQKQNRHIHDGTRTTAHNIGRVSFDMPFEMDHHYVASTMNANFPHHERIYWCVGPQKP